MSHALTDAVIAAAGDEALAGDLREFYESVDAAVAQRTPVCTNRGLCCNFQAYGHRLYVTAVELAYFVRQVGAMRPPGTTGACPYQVGGLCTAREGRPLGCRIYYCDPTAQHWQNDEYERQLGRLKAIGEVHGVPYAYVEWLSALERIAAAQPAKAGDMPPAVDFIDPRRLPVIES